MTKSRYLGSALHHWGILQVIHCVPFSQWNKLQTRSVYLDSELCHLRERNLGKVKLLWTISACLLSCFLSTSFCCNFRFWIPDSLIGTLVCFCEGMAVLCGYLADSLIVQNWFISFEIYLWDRVSICSFLCWGRLKSGSRNSFVSPM